MGAAWNTDLVKLYFAADQGRETVMTCVAGARIKKCSYTKLCYAAQEQLVLTCMTQVKGGCLPMVVGNPSTAALIRFKTVNTHKKWTEQKVSDVR